LKALGQFYKRYRFILNSIFTLTLISLLVYYVYSHWEELQLISKIHWDIFILIFLSILLNSLINAGLSASFFRATGAPITFWESFGLSNVAGAVSLVIPQGTAIVKAIYLKQKYKLPYSKNPAIFMGLLVIALIVGAIILTISNLVIMASGNTVQPVIWIITAIGLCSSLIFIVNPKPPRFIKRMPGVLLTGLQGWNELRANPGLLIKASILQLLLFFVNGITLYLTYISLEIDISLFTSIGLMVLIFFSSIVSLTPANLGITEGIIGYFTELSGYPFAFGIASSGLIRATGLVVTLVLAPISWYFLFIHQGIKWKVPGRNVE
jgi:uncharacterized membrane protein YbhN (UPF0104 family)